METGDTSLPQTSHNEKMSEHRQKKTAELISILKSSTEELDRAIENITAATELLARYQNPSILSEALEKAYIESLKSKSTLEEISAYLQKEIDLSTK